VYERSLLRAFFCQSRALSSCVLIFLCVRFFFGVGELGGFFLFALETCLSYFLALVTYLEVVAVGEVSGVYPTMMF